MTTCVQLTYEDGAIHWQEYEGDSISLANASKIIYIEMSLHDADFVEIIVAADGPLTALVSLRCNHAIYIKDLFGLIVDSSKLKRLDCMLVWKEKWIVFPHFPVLARITNITAYGGEGALSFVDVSDLPALKKISECYQSLEEETEAQLCNYMRLGRYTAKGLGADVIEADYVSDVEYCEHFIGEYGEGHVRHHYKDRAEFEAKMGVTLYEYLGTTDPYISRAKSARSRVD